jgi:signal peptidase I
MVHAAKKSSSGKFFCPRREIFSWLLILFVAVALAAAMRVLLLASFKVPSYSMLPAIAGGDYVLVNKMIPGPRVPVSWGGFFSGKDQRLRRLAGYRAVRRNDVLVFNFPSSNGGRLEVNMGLYFAKRCVALPGEVFCIDSGIYRVAGSSDTLGARRYQEKNFARLAGRAPDECFPFDTAYRWNVLHFGPLYVPRRGDSIAVDGRSAKLYGKLIAYERGKEVQVRGDTVYLGGEALRSYTFQNNYYFMAGDYVFDSQDSRYWGLLPEDHIVGKAFVIWKSKDPSTGKWRWERFFTKIL